MSTRIDDIAPTGLGRLYRGQTAVDFYGRRRIGLIVAVIAVVLTVGSLLLQGLNLGLDFEGGDAWDVPASETFGVEEADAVLADNGVSTTSARIQRRTSELNDLITVQTPVLDRDVAVQITEDFAIAADVTVDDINFSFTSSTWGSDITEAAVRALIIFLVIVSIFISIRFEWRMALAALTAMAHDVLVTVGVYSLFQFEVTPATVVAFLTILGYSLYDTIVVFDRIRENEGKYASRRMPYEDIVNISMNQVMMRSINTSISSILPVISLLLIGSGILGAVTLREFALALLIGMLSGVYSSIFVAAPLLATLKSNTATRKSRRTHRLTGDALRAEVVGAGLTGRVRSTDASRPADEIAEEDERSTDDAAEPAAATTAAVSKGADRLLTHPPRPRKKKRR
ncbi:MAG: protein translocase subunit SecF [Actinomycetota bacterium]